MQFHRFRTVDAFKEHFSALNIQFDLRSVELQGGRLSCITDKDKIIAIFAEVHPNPVATYLVCIGLFCPEFPVELFEEFTKEHNLGLLVVDMPEWCSIVGATKLGTTYRSPKATPGVILMKEDIVAPTNIKKRLRQIRESDEPYNRQIVLLGYSEADIRKNHVHLAAMNYEAARYQYEVN